ncbi:MAG: hypothetical protein LBQ66_12750 [Planctomycetaceae bacterium]|nr:hypothetical protein [Planctomycetaceae bacterium]
MRVPPLLFSACSARRKRNRPAVGCPPYVTAQRSVTHLTLPSGSRLPTLSFLLKVCSLYVIISPVVGGLAFFAMLSRRLFSLSNASDLILTTFFMKSDASDFILTTFLRNPTLRTPS